MNSRRYEEKLQAAAWYERKGMLKQAIAELNKAERLTGDHDELYHLRAWRSRLEEEAATK